MINKEESFWVDLLNKYFIDTKHICVKAVPSNEEKERLAKEDEERVEQRKQELGPEGLLEMANILKEANETNNVTAPESMITDIPIPSFENISNHPVQIYRVTDEHELINLNLEEFPVYTEAIDIHSNFVYVLLSINTENVPENLRLYLRLFLGLLAQCPVLRDGKIIPYDRVVNQFESDTIFSSKEIGIDDCGNFCCGDFSNILTIGMVVEPKKYHLAGKWLEEMLNRTIFDKDRVSVTASRILNDVAEFKRNGYFIVRAMTQAIIYKSSSNVALISVLQQQRFLTELLKRMNDQTAAEGVVDDLNNLRSILMQGSNVTLHIASNWKKIFSNEIELAKPFQELVETKDELKNFHVIPDHELINPEGNLDEETQGLILGLGAVESTYLYSVLPVNCDDLHPDLPALMLFGQYFTQVEGPFYREIRGKGYSYYYGLEVSTVDRVLLFNLYLSTNLLAAFKEAKTLVLDHIAGDAVWDPNLLQSAKTSLICEIVEREANLQNVFKQAVLSTFKKVPVDYNKTLIKQVDAVTEEDLGRVGEKYMKLLFGAEARTAIVCHSNKTKEIQAGFEE